MAKRTIFYRDGLLEGGFDEAKGEARLSFASETPVLRRDESGARKQYYEVLSITKQDADLGFLNREGLVLENHDEKFELGTVKRNSAVVDTDKKTRATILVDDAFWQSQMKRKADGIGVSVGYNRTRRISTTPGTAENGNIETRVYAFEPYEISLLTSDHPPADRSVGLGRMSREEREERARVKHRCGRCGGHGRCDRCRSEDEDEAEEDCETCEGTGDCPECEGHGHFESARSQAAAALPRLLRELGVDSLKKVTADAIQKKLSKANRELMKILYKAGADDEGGGGGTITEAQRDEAVRKADKDAREAAAKTYKERQKEISAVVATHKEKHGTRTITKEGKEIVLRDYFDTIANEALQKDESVADFKVRCLEAIQSAEPAKVLAREFVSDKEMAGFSLVRAIRSALKRDKGEDGVRRPDPKSFEGEIIVEYTKRCQAAEGGMGCEPQGFVVPPDAQIGNNTLTRAEMQREFRRAQNQHGSDFLQRDMQATVFGAGGAAVPTFWLLPYIELLRNKTVLNRLGMRTMSGLTGNVIIPRLEAPSTAYSLPEIQAGQASQQTLGQISANPHRVFNEVDYSKQLVFQMSPDAEALIRDDMFEVLALKRDILGLNGQGAASEPLGIFNTPGIGAVTFGATPTYIKMVLFETIIRSLNVRGKLAYTSTSTVKGSLKTVAEALTGATTIGGAQNAIWKSIGGTGDEDGIVNGCQAVDSQQIPNNLVLAGVFNHFIEFMWSGLDIVVDYYTKASNAEIRLVMNLWLDFAARHPQAFCTSTDAGNQ